MKHGLRIVSSQLKKTADPTYMGHQQRGLARYDTGNALKGQTLHSRGLLVHGARLHKHLSETPKGVYQHTGFGLVLVDPSGVVKDDVAEGPFPWV